MEDKKNDASKSLVDQNKTELDAVRAERDLLKFKLEALERSYIEKRHALESDGREVLRKHQT